MKERGELEEQSPECQEHYGRDKETAPHGNTLDPVVRFAKIRRKTMAKNRDGYDEFARLHPCEEAGPILCTDCDGSADCSEELARCISADAFDEGFTLGLLQKSN